MNMVKEGTREYETIVLSHTKRFHNCLDKIIHLTPSEVYLLLFLSEKADDECRVNVDAAVRQSFIEFIKYISKGQLIYKDVTIKKSLQALKKYDFLIPTEHRGNMWMNPKYFYNGRARKRLNMIKFIEDRVKEQQEIKSYVNGKSTSN